MKDLYFRNGRITILGGTGTLGQALTKSIHEAWPQIEITIVSRDEHKQARMKRQFPKCRYIIGDIKDPNSVRDAFTKCDVVFHVAALKHVDILESCPMESVKTNILGTENMAQLAIESGVSHFVFSSTDKAVDPINTYGYSKAISEKILFDHNRKQVGTRFSVYRWGNVLGSQGSAIPFFVETLKAKRRAYITDVNMTRYWLPIEWAVRYMLRTFGEAYLDQAMIPPTMKSARVMDIIEAIADLLDLEDLAIEKIPIRPGEKLHEAMITQHSQSFQSSETAPRYTIDELKALLAPLVETKKERAA